MTLSPWETTGSWNAWVVFVGDGGYNSAASPIVNLLVSKILTSLILHPSAEEINRGKELTISG